MDVKSTFHFQLALLPAFVLSLTSCVEESVLPDEPTINEIWFDKEASNLMIRFTDGDGDFGLSPNELDPPFNFYNPDSTVNFFYHNLHIEVFYKENGEFVPITLPANAPGFRFRMPNLTPQGQSKQLRVLVTVDFLLANQEIITPEMDTLMYRAVLVDRSLNVSLPADTDPVPVNN